MTSIDFYTPYTFTTQGETDMTTGQNRGTTDFDTRAGQKIRDRRHLIGLTQESLAEKLGVTFQQVQKYELGKNRIAAERLGKIMAALGVGPDFFFGEVDGEAIDVPSRRAMRAAFAFDRLAPAMQGHIVAIIEDAAFRASTRRRSALGAVAKE